jgi:hypothetical protein
LFDATRYIVLYDLIGEWTRRSPLKAPETRVVAERGQNLATQTDSKMTSPEDPNLLPNAKSKRFR